MVTEEIFRSKTEANFHLHSLTFDITKSFADLVLNPLTFPDSHAPCRRKKHLLEAKPQ